MGNNLVVLDTDDGSGYNAIDIIEIVACCLSICFCSNLVYQTLGDPKKRKILFYFCLGHISVFTTILASTMLIRLIQDPAMNDLTCCYILIFCESWARNSSACWSFMLCLILFITITRPKLIPSLSPEQKQKLYVIPFCINNLCTLVFGFIRIFATSAGIDEEGFFFHDGDACYQNFTSPHYTYMDLFSHISFPACLAVVAISLSIYCYHRLQRVDFSKGVTAHSKRLFFVLLFYPVVNGTICLLIFATHMYQRYSNDDWINGLDILVSSQGFIEFLLFNLRKEVKFCDCCLSQRDRDHSTALSTSSVSISMRNLKTRVIEVENPTNSKYLEKDVSTTTDASLDKESMYSITKATNILN